MRAAPAAMFAALIAALAAVDAAVLAALAAVVLPATPDSVKPERAFAQPSSKSRISAYDEINIVISIPLLEFSFKGSMFDVSIMPGRPSTTPAVPPKFRRASL